MSGVSVGTLARLMFGAAPGGRMIAVLGAFFDDSGTHTTAPVVALGGLLGTEEQWDAFAVAWKALLAEPLPGKPPLSQFHLSPCRAGDGEFQNYNRAERDRVTYLFRRVILDAGFFTVAAAVDKLAWNELITGELADRLGNNPLDFCLVKCVDTTLDIIRLLKPSEKIVFFFDEGNRKELEDVARLYRLQPKKYPEIAGIIFAPVPEVIALQGADMIALETYQYAQEWLKDRDNAVANAHFREYLKRDLSVGLVFDRDQIRELVKVVTGSSPSPGQPS